MIKIFGKDRQILTSDVETWVVKWKTYTSGVDISFPDVKECYKAFTDKAEARAYADALNSAMTLIGITSLPNAIIYKQETNSV